MTHSDPKQGKRSPHAMTRREFVRLGTAGFMTAGFLGACSRDNDDEMPPQEQTPLSSVVTPSPETFPQSVCTGDPQPDSMIFWTRVRDAADGGSDTQVQLVIGLDRELTNVIMAEHFTARVQFDGVVKIKVMMLDPQTTYYYQFQVGTRGSAVGRTKTAPLPDADVPVRFAFISCQDYTDRYYNTLALLGNLPDIDFVVHLGDYIYETTAGATAKQRGASFQQPQEAIPLPSGALAARSKSNYRDLYKAYRSDPMLQRVHENFPMIAIWDDHEFSNDSWQDQGTYFGGLRSEQDTARKRNAEHVYAEYMPLDFGLAGDGSLSIDDAALYPATQLYRDFHFGANLHLIMTDTRSFRPDHLVDEDAFPGSILASEPQLRAALGAVGIPFDSVRTSLDPYFNVDEPNFAPYKQVFTGILAQQMALAGIENDTAQALAQSKIQGFLSVAIANQLLEAYNQDKPPQTLPPIEPAGRPVGLAVYLLGKQDLFTPSGLGSRYFVVQPSYELLAGLLFQLTNGASEDILGADQEAWLRQTIADSSARWRIIGNSVSATAMHIDLRALGNLPPQFRQVFNLNVDQMDGFPNKLRQLLGHIAAVNPQTAMIAGDIHHSHAAHHGNGIHEFTITSVSSSTFKSFVRDVIQNPPFDNLFGVDFLVENLENLLLGASPTLVDDPTERQLKYTRGDVNGFGLITVDRDQLQVDFYHLPESESLQASYDDPNLGNRFQTQRFRLRNGQLRQVF